jgi:uncharacterized protein
MLRRWIATLGLVGLSCSAPAPTQVPPTRAVGPAAARSGAAPVAPEPPAAEPQQRADHSKSPEQRPSSAFLWTVASDTATVHLFGSVHVASAEMYPLDPGVEDYFAHSDTLVLEIDITPKNEQRAGRLMAQAGLLPPGETLWQVLDPATRQQLRTRLQELHIPERGVARFRPWFMSMFLVLRQMQDAGFQTELGLDRYFYKRATEDPKTEKQIIALETPEEQVALFTAMDLKAQVQDLRRTLTSDQLQELQQIAAEWRRGETRSLLAMMGEMKRDYPEAYQQFFTARNLRMARRVEELLDSDSRYFFVVGAGHMVGEDGIVALLRNRGRRVTQL